MIRSELLIVHNPENRIVVYLFILYLIIFLLPCGVPVQGKGFMVTFFPTRLVRSTLAVLVYRDDV